MPLTSACVCFTFVGIGVFFQGSDFVDARANIVGGVFLSQEAGFGGANFSLGEGKLYIVFLKEFEKDSDVRGVGGRVKILDDDDTKVNDNSCKAFD